MEGSVDQNGMTVGGRDDPFCSGCFFAGVTEAQHKLQHTLSSPSLSLSFSLPPIESLDDCLVEGATKEAKRSREPKDVRLLESASRNKLSRKPGST